MYQLLAGVLGMGQSYGVLSRFSEPNSTRSHVQTSEQSSKAPSGLNRC
jgi:hypothetical protein